MSNKQSGSLCTEKCKTCKYHSTISGSRLNDTSVVCVYILHGKGRRNCSAEQCDKYEPIDK